MFQFSLFTLRTRLLAASVLVLTSATVFAALEFEEPIFELEAAPSPLPSEQYSSSPGGVDMRAGQYIYSHTDLSIGGDNGLSLVRHNGTENYRSKKPFGNFSHNWEVFMVWRENTRDTTSIYTITAPDGRSASFTGSTLAYHASKQSLGPHRTLTAVGPYGSSRYWIYTASDGAKITFRPVQNSSDCYKVTTSGGAPKSGKCAYASEILLPDGEKYTFSYDSVGSSSINRTRLRRVTSNLGYAILFEYFGYSNQNNRVKKACVLNRATHSLPSNNICPAGVPTANYTYSSNYHLASATNALGNQYSYQSTRGSSLSPYNIRFYLPGDSQPYLTNRMGFQGGAEVVTRQTFSDGRIYNYTWDLLRHDDLASFEIGGGTYKLNSFPAVQVRYGLLNKPGPNAQTGYGTTPGPSVIVDELGRRFTANYCVPYYGAGGGCIIVPARYWVMPDGRRLELTYDAYHRNITQRRWKARSGTGLSDIVTSTTYGGSCATPLLCNKPTRETDAKGNHTDYTYDSVHGGVTSVTGPAVNGVRPITWYTYAQRYAWIKSGSSYVRASSPVWVKTSQHSCKTTQGSYNASSKTGSCAGGSADEVVSTYEYGPDAGPSNLNLKGMAVSANGQTLRTCYSYDGYGRKIGETAPRASLRVCP